MTTDIRHRPIIWSTIEAKLILLTLSRSQYFCSILWLIIIPQSTSSCQYWRSLIPARSIETAILYSNTHCPKDRHCDRCFKTQTARSHSPKKFVICTKDNKCINGCAIYKVRHIQVASGAHLFVVQAFVWHIHSHPLSITVLEPRLRISWSISGTRAGKLERFKSLNSHSRLPQSPESLTQLYNESEDRVHTISSICIFPSPSLSSI